VDAKATVTTLGDDHDGRDVRDVTIFLVVVVVVVAIVPEARQPSVVVHSNKLPGMGVGGWELTPEGRTRRGNCGD
jgi:hypothetical protein